MLNTLVIFTYMYLDARARLSISVDLRLSSDRRTILIGRGPHLAMIPSHGEVPIRMNIIFLPPWTTLSNCPSTNDLSAVLKPPHRKCRGEEVMNSNHRRLVPLLSLVRPTLARSQLIVQCCLIHICKYFRCHIVYTGVYSSRPIIVFLMVAFRHSTEFCPI